MKIHPVILAGGSGTRLWPVSREHFPKPLLSLVGKETLLQETTCRLNGLPGVRDALFVCNEEHRFLIAEQVHQLGKKPACIILEPEGRNTAPALTLAALYLMEQDPKALMVVMPADHVITDKKAFHNAVKQGCSLAEEGSLVTFGIVPGHPETGYGYIRKGSLLNKGTACKVAEFVEKPDAKTAQCYLESGEYLWNSGIFVMRVDRWLEELTKYRPEIEKACRSAFKGSCKDKDNDFYRVDEDAFLSGPSDSIDFAVMEKTNRAAVVPLEAGWSDIGSWSSLWEICPRDDAGNVIQGDVLTHKSRNNLLISQNRCLAAVGVNDLIVVETPDAVLVASKDNAQDVKEIVRLLKKDKREEYKIHRKVYRPWGSYENTDAEERFQVKRLSVKAGASLSLQMHHHRSEHWIVVKGTARVTVDDKVFTLSENQSTYIPLGSKHRLENPGKIPLEIIEVQSGSYLGEDDIERFEDIYDRC